ncbi:MAG: transcriptional repressor LexA [Candidatus Fimenecus sp.]
MQEITEVQKKIYDFLVERQGSVPPTVREIGARVGLRSTSSVQANLAALEKAGYIEKDPNKKRTIRVSTDSENMKTIPLVGTVAAGEPILAVQNIEGYIPFSTSSGAEKTLFALKVKGESMKNAGILPKDIVVVEQTPTASNGEIVVALLDDSATVKRFFDEGTHIRLQPENDAFEPIISTDVEILGRVIGLMRYY